VRGFVVSSTSNLYFQQNGEETFDIDQYLGQLICVGFNFAPPGWAQCDGTLLPISQNTALFSLLGTTFGGDGISTFALPDLRGRAPIHMGQGPGLSLYIIGQNGGVETTTLSVNQMPTHNHTINATSNPGSSSHPNAQFLASSGGGAIYDSGAGGNGVDSQLNSGAVNPVGGGQPFDNHMPYLTMNWLIATQGIFPSWQ
jgi:microcystin-dependent protein